MKPLRVLISLVLCTVCLTAARGQIGGAFDPGAKIIAVSSKTNGILECHSYLVDSTATILRPTFMTDKNAVLAKAVDRATRFGRYNFPTKGNNSEQYDRSSTARIKYNVPSDNSPQIIERNISDHNKTIDRASKNLKLATAVAAFTKLISRPVEQNIFPAAKIKSLIESAASYDTAWSDNFIHFVTNHNRLIDYK